jgi:hypothetical protein
MIDIEIQTNAKKARALAKKALKMLDGRTDELSQAQTDMLVEGSLIAAEAWRKVAVRGQQP